MFFWNHKHDYKIIENKSLTQLANENGCKLVRNDSLDKYVRDWFNFAHITSVKHDFNVVYEACFIYYVTLYLAEDGISAGAEDEYFMKKLDKRVRELYDTSRILSSDEVQNKTYFYDGLVNLFGGEEIRTYERKIFQHNILVSREIRQWFDEHKPMRQAVVSLLFGEMEKPHLNMNTGTGASVAFMLTYSEETVWRGLSSLGDGDRMRVLLY